MISYINLLPRLLLAGFLGAIIGFDREYHAKEAGYRTHFLVALGSALMMIISQYGFSDVFSISTKFDPSRIAAQVVSGIGFIGAGTIILQKQIIRGLTTAAGIWATAGVGLAIGAGLYIIGISSTILILIGLESIHFFFKGSKLHSYLLCYSTINKQRISDVIQWFDNNEDYKITSYELKEETPNNAKTFFVKIMITTNKKNAKSPILVINKAFPDIEILKVE